MRIDLASAKARKHRDGIASIIMLILLALVLSFIIANINTLSDLHNNVKRIEKRQIRRINPPATNASTNSTSAQAAK
jgi:hypothetical protein